MANQLCLVYGVFFSGTKDSDENVYSTPHILNGNYSVAAVVWKKECATSPKLRLGGERRPEVAAV
jgi:hypothetical protein